MQPTAPTSLESFLDKVRVRVERAGVFASVRLRDGLLECEAKDAAAPAFYRLYADGPRLWVGLFTKDRWLSQSIEQDLVHTGDKLEDLIEEELVDLGYEGGPMPCEHFRDHDLFFTFRSPLPFDIDHVADDRSAETAAICILAYEAAFRPLGDMEGADED
ncbi:MAG: hypothetical protein EA379_03705 [Phycisphaerales bacterium]|nr:MAG: hypothetical protein EA379_03705 [Phycisphaerales bacterium]